MITSRQMRRTPSDIGFADETEGPAVVGEAQANFYSEQFSVILPQDMLVCKTRTRTPYREGLTACIHMEQFMQRPEDQPTHGLIKSGRESGQRRPCQSIKADSRTLQRLAARQQTCQLQVNITDVTLGLGAFAWWNQHGQQTEVETHMTEWNGWCEAD